MNRRSHLRNKERNKYARLMNLVLKTNNGLDPIGIPNCNNSCLDSLGTSYDSLHSQVHNIEKLADYKKQRIERGFDDTELWCLDRTIAKYALPRLVEFKKVVNGYPPECENFMDWVSIIDKMIYSLDHVANHEKYDDELDEKFGVDWDGYFEMKKLPNGDYEIVHGKNYNEETMAAYREAKEKEKDRIQEGLELFGKYFSHLWW